MTAQPEAAVDPITFEVIRNKLQAIVEEQALTLQAASGSPVVTDATDFNNGIYLTDGSIVAMGPQVLFHSGTMSTVVGHIAEHCAENPGINEGDMFILNDPYRGAVHQPDVSIVAPLFHEGRHIAWAGSCAHQIDIGGMNFSSWSFKATDIQQEAMLLPGIKIVEGGEIRADIWQMIMGMTRLPMLVGLDLKAMIAANNVAARRLSHLMERYGSDVVEDVMHTEIDTSERRLRARLRALPDGVWRARDYLDHDGHENRLYDIQVAVHKQGDELTFDLTGTSPQAPGFINCTHSGLMGGLYAALLPILAPDIRWNHGLMRPVKVIAPEGIVCNATWPAPVSGATVSAVWGAMNVAVSALSRMAACAQETAAESAAVTKGSFIVFTLNGPNRDGTPFGTLLMDSMAGGGGAYLDHDGLTGGGDYCVPRPAITNVETAEAGGPLLYLYRSVVPDTAGAGASRGGATVAIALTPHDVEDLNGMVLCHGMEVPNSTGQFGGLEGATNEAWLVDGATCEGGPVGTVTEPADVRARGVALGAKHGFFGLRAGDVFACSYQGGGGYGDPLDRPAALVELDVRTGVVGAEEAERLYGVCLADGAVDEAATTARRADLRAQRLGDVPRTAAAPWPPAATAGVRIGPSLLYDEGRIACRCGQDLGPADGNFKEHAVTRVRTGPDHGAIALHEELELREHACPACGTLLESEVARHGADDLHTIELHQA
jgi:N-methylhydantoinase B